MEIKVDSLAPCKKLVRVSVPPQEVAEVVDRITASLRKQARIPGFRPGRAPKNLVRGAYAQTVEQQVKSELVGRAIQQFQKESEPRMLGDPSLEIIEFSEKSAFQFILRIEIEPEFDMPEYKGLKVKRETRLATGDLVKEAIREMRGESSAFVEVSRPSRKGDMIFLDGSATCEGRPLAEVLPGLKNRPSLETIAFVAGESSGRFPDLGEHLLGVVQGQSLELSLPVSEEVAGSGGSGKTVDFQLTVRGVEEPVAPELDADFARSKGHASMEELEEDVRRTLQGEFDQLSRESVREQLRAQLLSRIDCDYPDDVLERLTKEFVFRLVEFNLEEGGVSDALLQQHKGGIYTSAQRMAREHLKLMAAMPRIAKAEGIDASEEEVGSWMKEREIKDTPDARDTARQDVLKEKIWDFIEFHADVEEVLVGGPVGSGAEALETAGSSGGG